MTYILGDHWVICDRTGFKVRHNQTRKEWNNLRVRYQDFEERHPQDFVRGVKDKQIVPDPRPEQINSFVGPLFTQTKLAALPGDTTLKVESSVRFLAGDILGVTLSSGSVQRVTVQSVTDAETIHLSTATLLSGSVSVGASIVNYSAVSQPDIG